MKKQAILTALIILSSLTLSAKDIVVINSENGKPLVGAKVFTDGDFIVSDRYGKLNDSEITSVDFVTYNIIHLNSTLQNDTLIVDFPFTLNSPKKMGRLEGKVTNSNNDSIPYIKIELYKDNFTYEIYSNEKGNFNFDYLSEGEWEIVVDQSKDYDFFNQKIVINNEELVKNINLEDFKGSFGSITGVVIGKDGLPYNGAIIELVDLDTNVTTDKNGQFEINNLKEGNYDIRLKSVDSHNWSLTIEVLENNTSEIRFNLDSLIFSATEFQRTSDYNYLNPGERFIINRATNYGKTRLVTIPEGIIKGGNRYAIPDKDNIGSPMGGSVYVKREDPVPGMLTSGEVNDFRKWEMWADIAKDELSGYIDDWDIEPTNRYTVQLTSIDNRPVIDARVNLINQVGKVIWSARSDNTGKAELWANAYIEIDDDTNGLAIEVFYKGKRKYKKDISLFEDGINFIQVDEYCSQPNKVDILFAMDATASMGDELEYFKAELLDIIDRLENTNSGVDLRVGSLFYRDYSSPLNKLLNTHNFTKDNSSLNMFINLESSLRSGGDNPEAVDVALSSAVNEFTWSDDAIARIMFLILDAPPHSDAATMRRFKELTAKAAEMGIRIIPLVASGINKSDEYLMRSVALLTNGTYLFLTDDSGIGDSHIKPTTDSYDVEMMNEMIVRIINQFIDVPKCGSDEIEYANKIEDKIYNKQETINQDISEFIRVYPNPTDGPLTLSLQEEYDNLFVVDMNGKILFKVESVQGDIQVNLSNFPSGAYFLKYNKDGAWGSTQLQLIR